MFLLADYTHVATTSPFASLARGGNSSACNMLGPCKAAVIASLVVDLHCVGYNTMHSKMIKFLQLISIDAMETLATTTTAHAQL